MTLNNTAALDPIDEFIGIANRIASVCAIDEGKFPAASAALFDVAKRLQAANKHMASWLGRFTSCDIDGPSGANRIRELRDTWKVAKTGDELHKLKYRCRELWDIFDSKVKPYVGEIFPSDEAAQQDVEHAFDSLRGADDDMVDFIHDRLVGTIDGYVADVLPFLENGRPNDAERRRLAFDRDTSRLMQRLSRFGGELADLILRYADQAGIDVIDDEGEPSPRP